MLHGHLHVLEFIEPEKLSTSSLTSLRLNPVDFSTWRVVQQKLCLRRQIDHPKCVLLDDGSESGHSKWDNRPSAKKSGYGDYGRCL